MTDQKGLDVKGYAPTQSQANVDRVNANKVLEEKCLRAIDEHVSQGSDYDQRHVAIARTKIEEAFMSLNRAVFRPRRLDGELDG